MVISALHLFAAVVVFVGLLQFLLFLIIIAFGFLGLTCLWRTLAYFCIDRLVFCLCFCCVAQLCCIAIDFCQSCQHVHVCMCVRVALLFLKRAIN